MTRITIKCPTTNKVCYRTEEEAGAAIVKARSRPRSESTFGDRLPVRAYECPDCRYFHMTALPKQATGLDTADRMSVDPDEGGA